MEDVNRILVVTKSTKHCQKSVHYAVSFAKKYGAEIFILHVFHDPFGVEGWNLPLGFLPELKKEYEQMFKDAKSDLDRIIAAEKAEGLSIEEMIVESDPTEKIFEVVKEKNIDLLITSAERQWRLEHWLFGRDIEEIVRRMPCSVLLVRKELERVE